ncbi:MAG: type VI secretion system contractile sheath large subunit [Deltaproteobacteria bacterium]|nr:type VI secretion system contractile sheath large subunit [Deltaproteobacteria bacterium]
MSKPISLEKVELNIVSTMEKTQGTPEAETPFRIGIFGDFSGRTNQGIIDPALDNRRPLLVDRDNLDEVLAKLKVKIKLPILGKKSPPVTIGFSELDDFHPDSLFEKLEVFEALRDTRKGIKDPSTFAELAKQLKRADKASESVRPPKDVEKSIESIAEQTTDNLLDQVLEETLEKAPETESSLNTSEWDNFLNKIVTPHLVPDIEPQQAKMLDAVDAATSKLMQRILHHADFQAIESAWRAVYFLVSRLETDEQLKLYLIDISKTELAADMESKENLRSTGIYKLLAEQTVETFGGEPWAVLAGNYLFDNSREDAELLGRIAKIAKAFGAPFISSVSNRVLGCESLAETPDPDDWQKLHGAKENQAWEALRKLPDAAYLGLALPRFLLRLPYGVDTDPAEQFEFEEIPSEPDHNYYLWGNPSFACVYLLAQAFSQYGWNFRPGIIQDIEGLPLYIYKQDGGSGVKPCAEVALTERAAETILDKGIMPLLSLRNQDIIRLARFQSIADPLTSLAGRWS